MSGSRLGRGRGGRLAIYAGCLVVMALIVFLYRAATTEMTRLRDLHVQCAHQQEALAAQLQVIFEYKVRLEKSLAEEKNSNALAKQELQQRATREKSLRDKDSVEAFQRINSLQQQHKLLQSEHQDLKDECAKRQKMSLEESHKLEATLQDLRGQIREKNKEIADKEKSIESLKSQYLKVDTERSNIDNKYNELIKNSSDRDGTIAHLKKEVFQLKEELEGMKTSCKTTSSDPSLLNPRSYQLSMQQSVASKIASPRPQVSHPSKNNGNPIPIQAPRQDRSNDQPQEDYPRSNVESDRGDKPVNEKQDIHILPLPYSNVQINKPGPDDVGSFKEKQEKSVLPMPNAEDK
uniref:GOLIM4_0 protein n=1 Tax=Fopius arisanus TaxID=64838 RepID=A0A0C9QWF6_9HYME